MTVINLETTGTSEISTTAMKNLGLKIWAKKSISLRENKSHTKLLMISLWVLGIGVVAGLIWLVVKLLSAKPA
jgi:hypothetical protein